MAMMQARQMGDLRISRVVEYSAPTHDAGFLFPTLDPARAHSLGKAIGEAHYVSAMRRLVVTIQIWIVHAGANVILIDTGVGNRKPRQAARMDMLNTLVPAWLEAAGAGPEAVTHVVHTHLHADHVGWNTSWVDGRWEPTFPNARYLIPRTDYAFYRDQSLAGPIGIIDRAFEDSVAPIAEAGLLDLLDDTGEIAGCLEILPTPGHSPGQLAYRVRSGGETGLFCADVFHSPLQILDPAVNTAYCALPDEARRTRLRVLEAAAAEDTFIMPMHFGAPYCGYVRRQGAGFVFKGADWPDIGE